MSLLRRSIARYSRGVGELLLDKVAVSGLQPVGGQFKRRFLLYLDDAVDHETLGLQVEELHRDALLQMCDGLDEKPRENTRALSNLPLTHQTANTVNNNITQSTEGAENACGQNLLNQKMQHQNFLLFLSVNQIVLQHSSIQR